MDCLLISGSPRAGKNLTTIRVAHFLLGIGYQHAGGDPIPLRGTRDNFTAVLKHPYSQKRVFLNTKSDFEINANQLIDFYSSHEPIDVLITTIRDAGPERDAMEKAIRQLLPVNVIEIPLAKISGNRSNWDTVLDAYMDRIEALTRFILQGLPFQL